MAHADANIIFGAVIDDTMGDEVRVTVIAAGFERWEEGSRPQSADRLPSIFSGDTESPSEGIGETVDILARAPAPMTN